MTSVPPSPLSLPGFTLQHISFTVPKLCLASGVSVSNAEKDVASVSDLEMGFHEGSAGFPKKVSRDSVQQNPPALSDSPTDSPLALAPPSFPFWDEKETAETWTPFG